MNIISGFSKNLQPSIKSELYSYRYGVFVEALGWELDTQEGIEVDQFDHEDTLYVVAKNDEDDIVGCARLLPTTEPYLLADVFPELLNGMEIPKSPDVWEISRFTNLVAGKPCETDQNGRGVQMTEFTFSNLLNEAIECAKQHGAKRLISVSPVGIERLLRKAGIRSHRVGPPKIVNGHAIVACWIDVSE